MSIIIAPGRRNFKSALARSRTVPQLLDREHIERHCRTVGHRWRESFWSPGMTLLAMVLQAAEKIEKIGTDTTLRPLMGNCRLGHCDMMA